MEELPVRKKLRVWLDDERPMPSDFTNHVTTAQEAIDLLKTGQVDLISLDHDLGSENVYENNGYVVAEFIEEFAFNNRCLPCIEVRIHTANSSARTKMESAIRNACKFCNEA